MPEIKIFDALPEEEILARWKYRLMKKEDVDVPEE